MKRILIFLLIISSVFAFGEGGLNTRIKNTDNTFVFITNKLSVVGGVETRSIDITDVEVYDSLTFTDNRTFVLEDGSTIIGQYAGIITPGTNVTIMGYRAGMTNAVDYLVAYGHAAARGNIGPFVTAIGYESAADNQGENVITIGYQAGRINTGDDSVFIGKSAGEENDGGGVVGIGVNAIKSNTEDDVIAIGNYALENNTGIESIGIGRAALQENTGDGAIAIGYQAGQNNNSDFVCFMGNEAAENLTDSEYAVVIGYQAGQNGNTFSNSVIIGSHAGQNATNLIDCVTMGYNALKDAQDVSHVNAIGYLAGQDIKNIDNITLFSGGSNAHYFIAGSINNEVGSGYYGIMTTNAGSVTNSEYLYFADLNGDGREERYFGKYNEKPDASRIYSNGIALLNMKGNFVVEDTGTTTLHFRVEYSLDRTFATTNYSVESDSDQSAFKYIDLDTYTYSNFPSTGLPLKDQNAAESFVVCTWSEAIIGYKYYVRAAVETNSPSWTSPEWKFNRVMVAE
jgi:hypothetical protein